jgi:hypothetical protein
VRRLFTFAFLLISLLSFGLADDLTDLKRMEVDRLRLMAENGSIPRARLDQAQAELADAEDNGILRRYLYGAMQIEDFTKEQTDSMIAAAKRLVDRQQERYDRMRQLVVEGVVPRASLMDLQDDLSFRRKAYDLAVYRAKLVDELSAQVNAEAEVDEQEDPGIQYRAGRAIERYDGLGLFRASDFARIAAAFERKFYRPLPVSARGDTALHRSMGFDHRGRFDIAISPDQQEGVWLRDYLRKAKLPYYAFRAAIRGKATAPHIHLGPPSLRLRTAD